MNTAILTKMVSILFSILTILTTMQTQPTASGPVFGAFTSNPSVAAIFETSLSAPIGSTDTTLSLASITIDSAGDTLVNGSTYALTIDQGQPNQEFVKGTLSGTTLTGLTRGLSPLTGTSTIAALGQSHRRGADVKITDWPTLGILNNQLNGSETIPNPLLYASNFTPNFWTNAATNTIVTLGEAQAIGSTGCANSSTVANGCVQIATQIQAASTTITGSTGANLVIPASMATSSNDVPGLHAVITQNNGTIKSNQIDQTANYTWTATSTFQKSLISGVNSLSDAATTTLDWSLGNTAVWNIAGNHAIAYINVQPGESIKLLVCQDATGSRTVPNWGNSATTTMRWNTGFAPTLSTAAGKCDVVSLFTATSSTSIFGAATTNF